MTSEAVIIAEDQKSKTQEHLARALAAYGLTVAATSAILIILRVRVWSAVVIGLIIGLLALNALLIPTQLDLWEEFTSYTAAYSFIQTATPIIVIVYALGYGLTDRVPRPCKPRGGGHP